MRSLLVLNFFAAFLASSASSASFPVSKYSSGSWRKSQESLTVSTTSGSVSGFINNSYPGVRQFLGIPFAQPPTNNLRFEPPQALLSPRTSINATAAPPACPQIASAGRNVYSVSSPGLLNYAPWSEDCLALSIWAPTHQEEKLPVFIWIHGKGLQMGSASVPYQQPPQWVQRTQGLIVVELQYRLNIFGFPNAAGLNRTNLGLLDQRLGIEWVRENIAAFGGDLDTTVLWGESAGAASVDAQNFAFPDDPIVQGFISDSGSVFFPPGAGLTTLDPTHSNFSTVARGLGCPSDPAGEVSCLRSQSAEAIISFLGNYTAVPQLNFIATPDGIVVFANYTDRYAKGLLSSKPAIFGSNANEGAAQAPFPADPTTMTPNQTIADILTLVAFQCPVYNSGLKRTAAGRKTYQYYYAGNFSDISPFFWEGAYHMSELPLIFGTRGSVAPASDYEIEVSNAMQDLWLGFARNTQDPESAGWVEASTGQLLELGSADVPVRNVQQADIYGVCIKTGLSPDQNSGTST